MTCVFAGGLYHHQIRRCSRQLQGQWGIQVTPKMQQAVHAEGCKYGKAVQGIEIHLMSVVFACPANLQTLMNLDKLANKMLACTCPRSYNYQQKSCCISDSKGGASIYG